MVKFWIGVASKDHVKKGIELGICQFCHGKLAPSKKLQMGDFIIFYSSKALLKKNSLKKFTAIGKIIDDSPYEVQMNNNSKAFRRKVAYFDSIEIEIKNLINDLLFIKNKKYWGIYFRSGFFEIDKESFLLIAKKMINEKKILETLN